MNKKGKTIKLTENTITFTLKNIFLTFNVIFSIVQETEVHQYAVTIAGGGYCSDQAI